MELHELGLSVRAFNAVCRAGIQTVTELRERYQTDPEALRLLVGRHHFEEIGRALAEKFSESCTETCKKSRFSDYLQKGHTTESTPESEVTPMTEPRTTVIVSESYTRAVTLTRDIIANAQAAQQSLYEVCKGLKEMRDGKLYKELGYQNFEDYTENEVGIKRRQAYNYIQIATGLPTDFVQSTAQIGIEKLALLAKLDEPTRNEVTETVDVESVTVKELKAQITALQSDKDKLESQNADLGQKLDSTKESLASKDKQFQAAMESKKRELDSVLETKERLDKSYHKKHEEWLKSREEVTHLTERIHALEAEVQAIENRPVEVAVSEAEAKEIERLKNALENAKKPDRSAIDRGKFYALKTIFEGIVDELESLLDELHDDPRIRYINELDNYWTDNLLYLKREGEGAGK